MARWISVVVCISLLVVVTYGDCTHFDAGQILDAQVNTSLHTPLHTVQAANLVQCIQNCYYIATCNKVNFAPSTYQCLFFDINGPESTVSVPDIQWQAVALADVIGLTTPYICSSDSCPSGESCVVLVTGPTCLKLS